MIRVTSKLLLQLFNVSQKILPEYIVISGYKIPALTTLWTKSFIGGARDSSASAMHENQLYYMHA